MHRRPRVVLGLAIGLVVTMLAASALAIWGAQREAREDLRERFDARARTVAYSVQALLEASFEASHDRSARRLRGSVVQRDLDALARASNSRLLVVMDAPSGVFLGASSRTPAAVLDRLRTRPPETAAVLAGRPMAASNLVDGLSPGGSIIFSASALETADGRRVVVQGLDARTLNIFLSEFLGGGPNRDRVRAVALDAHGRQIGGPGVAAAGAHVEKPLLRAYRTRRSGSFDGRRYFTSAAIGGTPWRVVMTTTQSRLYASLSGSGRVVAWIVWGLFAWTCGLALVLMRRSMATTRDLEAAYSEMEQLNARLTDSYTELAQRAGELQHSNEELEQFASIASHDLREPLRKVIAFGDQLEARFGDQLPDEAQDYVRRMRNASVRMQTLIDDLLALARISTKGEAFSPLDLGEVVDDVLGDLELAIREAGATVEVAPLPEVVGDASQLRQLMQNLIANAVKFRREDVPPRVRVRGDVEGGRVVLEVADNGVGFEDQHAEHIFGPFKRLHSREQFPGTGIGLALCRRIAERHGGTIEARGVPGEGATFTVTLPAGGGQPSAPHPFPEVVPA